MFSCIKAKLSISFWATSCHKVIAADNGSKAVLSIRSARSQKVLLTLWAESGRAVLYESVVGTTNEVFPWSKASCLMSKGACCWVLGILVIDQGELERGRASLGVQCEDASLSVLNLVVVNKKCASVVGIPKSLLKLHTFQSFSRRWYLPIGCQQTLKQER